jgi:transcriptional regulator with XRE-family HTH domain
MSAEAGQQKSDALQELMAIVQVTPGQNLSPIPEGACSEVREFTETVRALFAALEMSLTRFSVHMHCDKGTVSRYLSGERIPPQDFLDRLFKSIYDARGALITPEVQSLIHEQYLVALRAHNPARYQVQKLSDQLAVAMLEKQQSELTIFALQDAIVKKQEKIYALEMDKRAIQDAWAAERQESDEAIEGELSLRHRLEQTIRNLRHDVQKLNERLRSTQLRARAAEERCQQLEAQVDQQLEAQIHSADASTMDEQPTVNTPRRRPRAPTRPRLALRRRSGRHQPRDVADRRAMDEGAVVRWNPARLRG